MKKGNQYIADVIHGTVELTPLETEIVSTKSFQRLHNVRQLGLAHLVFPGAGYSRLSHSIGALHNASEILESIKRNCRNNKKHRKLIDDQTRNVRLAALLHDVGHYPFSHATEHVAVEFYANTTIKTTASPESAGTQLTPDVALKHEQVGGKVLEHDAEIRDVLSKHDVDIDDFGRFFNREKINNTLSNIVSSDLDCDRLDYLRRTAYFSGLPYGHVDIQYLTNQATLDVSGKFCFKKRAMRAADHLLVSRFFDYLQVPYHKTVTAFEWSLQESIKNLLSAGKLELNRNSVIELLKNGAWAQLDDARVIELLRHQYGELQGNNDVVRLHIRGVLERKPPKFLAAWEELLPIIKSNGSSAPSHVADETHSSRKSDAESVCDSIAKSLGIPRENFFVWSQLLKITKIGGKQASVLRALGEDDDASSEQLVRVLGEDNESIPIIELKQTLMHTLADRALSVVRIYAIGDARLIEGAIKSLPKAIKKTRLPPPSSK